jgi:glycosyltransferase involved in cell wall biosynthesis
VIYAENEESVPGLMQGFDAVVATACHSVRWLQSSARNPNSPIRGYYVQDFEPYFFEAGSPEFEIAWNSYTLYPDLVRITKTEWNRDIVMEKVGAESVVIGQSVDIDLYRPRRRKEQNWPQRPLRIAAMIRPSSPRRAPELTLEVLRDLYHAPQCGDTVEMILFGCETDELKRLAFANEFPWRNAGKLHRAQVASLMNEVDLFVDFSSFQAMGLTAMEAMSCGVAVIVPAAGGARSYAKHQENSLVIDTTSKETCLTALELLVTDAELRKRLQRQAIFDICAFYPERAAYNLLDALFQT